MDDDETVALVWLKSDSPYRRLVHERMEPQATQPERVRGRGAMSSDLVAFLRDREDERERRERSKFTAPDLIGLPGPACGELIRGG